MIKLAGSAALATLLGTASLLGGCATKEEVERAQATADSALSAANQAQQTGTAAQAAAQNAQQGVDQLRSDVNALNQKIDQIPRKGQRG